MKRIEGGALFKNTSILNMRREIGFDIEPVLDDPVIKIVRLKLDA